MKLTSIYIIATVLLVQPMTANREKYKNDFKRIQTAYKSYPNLSFNVSYSSHHNSPGDTSVTARYCFKGNKFYYKMAQVEVVKNDEYIISINHKKKDIVLYAASSSKDNYVPLELVDSFFNKENVNLEYIETDHGKTGRYIMDMTGKKKAFNKMELEFDKASYLVQRMRLFLSPESVRAFYNEPIANGTQTASIDYVFSNYKFGNIDDKLFNTRSYIIASGDQFEASDQYRGYHVVSLIPAHK